MRTDASTNQSQATTVSVTCTGKVRTAVGSGNLTYTFHGRTLRAFLESFFSTYQIRDLIMAESTADERAPGWAPPPTELPGRWAANPPGERTRRYARVTVNGRFNEHLNGLDTVLSDGDRIGLLNPFVYCV